MKIISVPDPVLTSPSQTITSFDKRLTTLLSDMKHALLGTKTPKGVGLAAPQIGAPYRVFITRPTEKSPIRVFINPEIIKKSGTLTEGVPERENKLEGCRSIPKIWGKVKRATSLTLRYDNEQGTSHEEAFDGFMATIIQHETDHTNGTLFTHRVLEQKGKLYETTKDTEGKEVLEEIHI